MLDLKIDPKLYHHYLITVGLRSLRSKNPGERFLKHGPLHFTNDDVKNVQSALILGKDKLFKTSQQQAMRNFECSSIVSSVRGMKLASMVNDCTMHHFSSEFEIEEEWFETLVSATNYSDSNKKLLQQSRVIG